MLSLSSTLDVSYVLVNCHTLEKAAMPFTSCIKVIVKVSLL